jgi:hypothetical protein
MEPKKQTPEEIYLNAILLEKEGKFKEATTLYVRALKMKPDLDRVLETLEVNGVLYDMNGDVIPQEYQDKVTKRLADFFANEEEDRVRLTEQEREELAKHEHTFDFQLGEEQIKFLEDNGYLVIENFFSQEVVDRCVEQMFLRACMLTGLVKDNHATWTHDVLGVNGFVDLWHLPAYYEMRTDPKLYSLFAQVLRDPKLTVSLDRVSMKPPAWIEKEVDGQVTKLTFPRLHGKLSVHTDLNLWYLGGPAYQGSVCLSDCPVGGGGFVCLPGHHKLEKIRNYRTKYESGEFGGSLGNKRMPPYEEDVFLNYADFDTVKSEVKEIPMKKGDFLIWSSRLPHANAVSTSNQWRLQCFIRCIPRSCAYYEKYRQDTARAAKIGRKPDMFSSGNDTDRGNMSWECVFHEVPKTTELGKKMLGLAEWD